MKTSAKFAVIGAGSVSFSPATITDILCSEDFMSLNSTEIFLMDIRPEALDPTRIFCERMAKRLGKNVKVGASVNLDEALYGADFVITAIEVDRYRYWAQDFHVPRRYGFRQIYGENGGPGGMFHTLRNLPPMLAIARSMEKCCPDAWLLNYTNPEAKLVEAICRMTRVKAVGLCHGEQMGLNQLSAFLKMPRERIGASALGLNHFGWFTRVWDKYTGEDLYPLLRANEKTADPLAQWDELALSRLMLRLYGLWPYPGTNHIGEYIAWSDAFLASANMQYYFDPAAPGGAPPAFIYSLSKNPTSRELFPAPTSQDSLAFDAETRSVKPSGEYGIPIAEAIFFDKARDIGTVNVPNKGFAADLPENMVIELPAAADGNGLHPKACDKLPTAISAAISLQGAIHKLIFEAYEMQSRNCLLQALLLDPTVSSYYNAVALINEMCDLQNDILPHMYW